MRNEYQKIEEDEDGYVELELDYKELEVVGDIRDGVVRVIADWGEMQ